MAVTYSPVERLEFALKWESARLSYFESLGWKSKVKEQNYKIDKIQYELNQLHQESWSTTELEPSSIGETLVSSITIEIQQSNYYHEAH